MACRLRFREFISLLVVACLGLTLDDAAAAARPHIIFVMADDMGWGETGYRQHPLLKTPQLDAMAANGLRFERFYAGGPVCSPTRASVLTGRSNDRTGVLTHGYPLRLQEKTIAQALQAAGYVTGHFGKWHLSGFAGPGVPILADDPRSPGKFGFDEWVSASNFFDLNPLLSRQGNFEEFTGDSSDITVAEATRFLKQHQPGGKPLFAVVWFGSPHQPFRALPADRAAFADLNETSAQHYGELVALDRSVGVLRQCLRDLQMADNTLLVFCSDNGGLPRVTPGTTGGLRGFKGSVYEGGLRVPGIIEWPAVIQTPRVTDYPACTMDLFPTVAEILNLSPDSLIQPVDGISLLPLFQAELPQRIRPIPFRFHRQGAWTQQQYKLVSRDIAKGEFELYDLLADPQESRDLATKHPEILARLKSEFLTWNASVDASFSGKDYPAGRVEPPDPPSRRWPNDPAYAPYLEQWKDRPEYRQAIEAAGPSGKRGQSNGTREE